MHPDGPGPGHLPYPPPPGPGYPPPRPPYQAGVGQQSPNALRAKTAKRSRVGTVLVGLGIATLLATVALIVVAVTSFVGAANSFEHAPRATTDHPAEITLSSGETRTIWAHGQQTSESFCDLTGPDGGDRSTSATGGRATLDLGSDHYALVAKFTADSSGTYRLDCVGDYIVSSSDSPMADVGAPIAAIFGAVGFGFATLALFVVGLVLWLSGRKTSRDLPPSS